MQQKGLDLNGSYGLYPIAASVPHRHHGCVGGPRTLVDDEIEVPIQSDQDIVTARQKGRGLAAALNFSSGGATLVALAISELARNIVVYAKKGQIRLKAINGGPARKGIQVVAHDEGPGIVDVDQALRDGFSTSGGLGIGLPGVRRLMDEFRIESKPNQGTTVTVTKWKT
jgi:serine/threonine-protein kinase RsbT